MIYTHLNDVNTFKKLERNIGNKIIKDLNCLISKYNSCLVEEEVSYSKNTVYLESRKFCGLPKIHQSEIIKQAFMTRNSEVTSTTESFDLKVRPIAVGPRCPTRKLIY